MLRRRGATAREPDELPPPRWIPGAAVSAEPFQGMVAIGQLLHGEQGLKLTWPEGRMQGENPAHVDYG